MSYRAGIGGGMVRIGLAPRDPHIECDGCGTTHGVGTKSKVVADWFLARKPPPKWRGTRVENADGSVSRTDYCPRCVEEKKG
jgi:hypothetical protein